MSSNITFSLPEVHESTYMEGAVPPSSVVCPAELLTSESGYMRGHGTYSVEDNQLVSSVAGVVDKVNKLICVRPLKTRYVGEIGDVIVGRITQVAQKKWIVDTNSRLNSVLMLSAVNLPGNELRRRTADDELLMREYFTEGDLIAGEVQQVRQDGEMSLHRIKYGKKLGEGTFVKVSPSLIKRTKSHYHVLHCGVHVILGMNGYVWVSLPEKKIENEKGDIVEYVKKDFTLGDRNNIARVRNCIVALNSQFHFIYDTSISYAFDASLTYAIKDILDPRVQVEITNNILEMNNAYDN